jgi:hypothetical protein
MFAYQWKNTVESSITMLDVNGTSIWHLAIPYNLIDYNMLIEYKAINSATDMIIATSGKDFFHYNRIISSSTPPYTVLPIS